MWGIRTSDIREQFGEEKQAYLEQQAATYLHQGLLIYENDTLTLSKEGIFISGWYNERPFMGIKVCCRHLTKPLNYTKPPVFTTN